MTNPLPLVSHLERFRHRDLKTIRVIVSQEMFNLIENNKRIHGTPYEQFGKFLMEKGLAAWIAEETERRRQEKEKHEAYLAARRARLFTDMDQDRREFALKVYDVLVDTNTPNPEPVAVALTIVMWDARGVPNSAAEWLDRHKNLPYRKQAFMAFNKVVSKKMENLLKPKDLVDD